MTTSSQLKRAYDLGVRHVQLVHYIKNPLGDFQTERPAARRADRPRQEVVEECNRLGILVDLAHCSPDAVSQALGRLEGADRVVAQLGDAHGQAGLDDAGLAGAAAHARAAKAIADKGGVVGLWACAPMSAATPEAYAARLSEMADWLGEDHVGFGTDMNAHHRSGDRRLRRPAAVVALWQERGSSEARIRKIAIENYARVLKQAMDGREA